MKGLPAGAVGAKGSAVAVDSPGHPLAAWLPLRPRRVVPVRAVVIGGPKEGENGGSRR